MPIARDLLQICAGSPPTCLALCEPGQNCPGDVMCGGLAGRTDIGVCATPMEATPCDLIAQDCPMDQGCYLVQSGAQCSPPTPDAASLGEVCTSANGCTPGLVCVGPTADDLSCRQPCQMGADSCPDGDICISIGMMTDVGVCDTP